LSITTKPSQDTITILEERIKYVIVEIITVNKEYLRIKKSVIYVLNLNSFIDLNCIHKKKKNK